MRAVFTVALGRDPDFPTNSEILEVIRKFGWEFMEVKEALIKGVGDDDLRATYSAKALPILDQMPEAVSAGERDKVVFCGLNSAYDVQFIITRAVLGEVKFRLLHTDLARLQAATREMVSRIKAARLKKRRLGIIGNNVFVYERGFENQLMTGRVISNPFWETITTNVLDALLFVFAVLIVVPVFFALATSDPPASGSNAEIVRGTLERGSTVVLTTALVSFIGLLPTFFGVLRQVVVWSAVGDRRTRQ